jgi:hypothetical protein
MGATSGIGCEEGETPFLVCEQQLSPNVLALLFESRETTFGTGRMKFQQFPTDLRKTGILNTHFLIHPTQLTMAQGTRSLPRIFG